MTALSGRQVADRQHRHTASAGGGHETASTDRQDRHLAVTRPPGGDTASTADRQPGDDRQDRQVAVTHRIVASRQDRQVAEGGDGRVAGWLSDLRPFRECADQIDYARNAAYSVRTDGWWRNVNVAFVFVVTVPVIILCDTVKFCVGTLPRFLLALIIAPLALMLANHIPLIAWLVPDWADFTTLWATDSPPAEPSGAVG